MTPREQAVEALAALREAHDTLTRLFRGVECVNIKGELRKLRNATEALSTEQEMHL